MRDGPHLTPIQTRLIRPPATLTHSRPLARPAAGFWFCRTPFAVSQTAQVSPFDAEKKFFVGRKPMAALTLCACPGLLSLALTGLQFGFAYFPPSSDFRRRCTLTRQVGATSEDRKLSARLTVSRNNRTTPAQCFRCAPLPAQGAQTQRVMAFGRIRLTQRVRFQVSDILLPAFQGWDRRKNRLPVGGVMVMLLVPPAVVMV